MPNFDIAFSLQTVAHSGFNFGEASWTETNIFNANSIKFEIKSVLFCFYKAPSLGASLIASNC